MHQPRKERQYETGGMPVEVVRQFLKDYDLKDGDF